ncbi:MAG: carbohydrate ABC transporter permease [Firmicutes bacterium]|nr:carbohydrate ABC transporter permease [Bacillota bacterium]
MRGTKRDWKPLIYVGLTLSSLIVIIPILWMFSTSIKTLEETFSIPPRWIPLSPTLDNYINIWKNYPLARYFFNSIFVVSVSTIISLAFSCLAGYGVSRFRFAGKGAFLTFLLATQMFPSIMLLIPYFKLMRTFGLINTYTGLILVYISFTIPFCSWMMLGYFEGIPKELDDAALIDGCNRLRTFLSIILPLTLPGLVATAIYSFLVGWNEYMFALVLTTTTEMKTVAVGIGELIGQYRIAWNDMMTVSILASIPLAIVFLFLQKYLINSLTAGAVKQ